MAEVESTGERLKAARLERGLTIDQVVEQTRINRHYIEALETGDTAAIPSEFYAVSFLRQYAGVLGLPSDKMVGALRQQLADLEEIPEQRLFNEVSLSPHALRAAAIEKIRRWTGEFFANRSNAVVAGILMLAGALGWWYVGSLDTVAVAAPSPGADVESQRAPEVGAGAAERTGTGASNSVRPTTTSIAPASEPARLGSAETLAIQLQASGEVWVRAVVDGGRSQESIMQAGNRRAFRARERLQFTAGNAGAITLVVNGQVQDSIGGRGQVRHVEVDRDGWKVLPPGSF